MKTYAIQLDTVQNFADYIYMLEHFSFRGVIKTGRNDIDPYDLISLFERAPADTCFLQIDPGEGNELDAMEEYLKHTGLLVEYRWIA